MPVLDSLFSFLFRYPVVVFQRGKLALDSGRAGWLAAALVAAAAVVAWSYLRAHGKAGRIDRLILFALRAAMLALLVGCLARPRLILSSLVPQQNFLAVLVDDSRSMRVADQDGRARGEFVARTLGSDTAALRAALAQRFRLRFFRFSSAAQRTDDPTGLTYAGTTTHIGAALDQVRQELAGVPLAGVVLVSDGADDARESLAAPLLSLKAAHVPVFAVGVGQPRLRRDIEVRRVDAPAAVLRGTAPVVDVVVSQTGFGGRTVPLYVEDGGRVVAEQDVRLPPDGEPAPVRVRFPADSAGPRRLRFRIPVQRGEVVTQNNEQTVLLRVSDRRARILYVEGEPRWEVKFLRRAVADDPNLRLVVLLRTAPRKLLRLDVDSADELVAGFPTTRQELFRYDGIVLGSLEAGWFTHEQLQLMADFVSERGGGLLMLGGRKSFAAGGYAGTPLADALPVELEPSAAEGRFAPVKVEPTRAGRAQAVTQLAPTEDSSLARWQTLPEVSVVNRVTRVKPGATALLVGRSDSLADPEVILAAQRYGRGRALAFTPQDSWLWHMDASVPVGDMRHTMFWRQLLRALVDGDPAPVQVVAADRAEPGQPVSVRAEVTDSGFLAVDDAAVTATVSGPQGSEPLSLPWSVQRDGSYGAPFTPGGVGLYQVALEARRGGRLLGSDTTWLAAAPSTMEYFGAGMRESLLRRIAQETGGRFYTPADVARLPEDIRYVGSGTSRIEEKDLWDLPAVFLLLLALAGAEWGWRRARGLA